MDAKHSQEKPALIAALAAFGMWGLVPIYWKLLTVIPAAQILSHRIVWTTVFMAILLTWKGRWNEIRTALANRRMLIFCICSGLSISLNWFLFIWAVNAGRVLETSLGYFMTPLVNVLLGAVFLRERLTKLQLASVALALAGVFNLAIGYGRAPWIALALCLSFGIYGLLRKRSGVAAIPGQFIETVTVLPIAFAYLVIMIFRGTLIFGPSHIALSGLLIVSGVVTGLPLVWFAFAARNLRLTTVGFLQYLAPTMTFFLGVFVYHEPFTHKHLITFALIWIALAMFTAEALLRWRSTRVRVAVESAIAGEI